MPARPALEGTTRPASSLADEPTAQGQLFDRVRHVVGNGEYRGMEFLEVDARRVLDEVRSTGVLPFRWTIDPYLAPEPDAEHQVVVKANVVERLKADLHPSRWRGEPIAIGADADPYQRAEGKYRLTRGLVGALLEANSPFSILTRSTLVLRDVDLLGAAARRGLVHVSVVISTVDQDAWRRTEPGSPPPARRLRAVEQLNAAGIPTGVLIGPLVSGVSDAPEQIEAVAKAVVGAGATHIASNLPKADRVRIATELRAAVEAAGGQLGWPEDGHLAAPVDLAAVRRRRTDPDDQLTFAL